MKKEIEPQQLPAGGRGAAGVDPEGRGWNHPILREAQRRDAEAFRDHVLKGYFESFPVIPK